MRNSLITLALLASPHCLLAARVPVLEPPPAFPGGVTVADWSQLRGEYDRHRRDLFPAPQGGGYQARSFSQRWLATFDGQGFSVAPKHGQWTWGLALQRYGLAGHLAPVGHPLSVTAKGDRAAYRWDDLLTEWFHNAPNGVEHGFTLRHRPPGTGRHLILDFDVRGELKPHVAHDAVEFRTATGQAALRYHALAVHDAAGRKLPARFAPAGPVAVRIEIDDSGARYPLTVDPLAQQDAYLKATPNDDYTYFGSTVSLSGDTAVVGSLAGTYTFVRTAGVWSYQSSLPATGPLALSGQLLAIGNQVYQRSGTTWSFDRDFTNPGLDANSAVALDGRVLAIAANSSSGVRTVYSFYYTGALANLPAPPGGEAAGWVSGGAMQASNHATQTTGGQYFGWSVAVSGHTIVVGSIAESSNATGVNGNQSDTSAPSSGAAYVYHSANGSGGWTQQAYLKASNSIGFTQNGPAPTEFGYSVAISGDTIVVGGPGDSSASLGVNWSQALTFSGSKGAAYVFTRNGSGWSQSAYLKATHATTRFGSSVAIAGDLIVAGTPADNTSGNGINPPLSYAALARDSGAAFLYYRTGANWQTVTLKASNSPSYVDIVGNVYGQSFGAQLAVSDNTVLIGSRNEHGVSSGVNGTQAFGSPWSGAAYAFTSSLSNQYLLATSVNASGLGTVTPPTSLQLYLSNATVTAQTVAACAVFSGWTGPVANAASPTTTVLMDEPKAVTANFTLASAFSPSLVTVSGAGGTSTTSVTCPNGLTSAFSSEAWLTVVSVSNNTVTYRYTSYAGSAPRDGTITIPGATLTVRQNPLAACTYSLGNVTHAYATADGFPTSNSFPILASHPTCQMDPADLVSDAPWLSAYRDSSTSIYFDTPPPNPGLTRVAHLTLAGGAVFTVTQFGADPPGCTYSFSPASAIVGAQQGTGTVNVVAAPGCGSFVFPSTSPDLSYTVAGNTLTYRYRTNTTNTIRQLRLNRLNNTTALTVTQNRPPVYTATRLSATGLPGARVWNISLRNNGPGPVSQLSVAALTLSPLIAQPGCAPVVSGLPASLGTVPAAASTTFQATINFTGCSGATEFNTVITLAAPGLYPPATGVATLTRLTQ